MYLYVYIVFFIGMGDTITLNFTPEQYKFFLDSCIEEVNRVDAKGNSLHIESWAIVGKK